MRLCRERVDITSVLKNILDNYPAGGAVLRELLQNSDDAGATSQIFILDKRTHPKDKLPHTALSECQGPALLAINDATFQAKDWKALTSIHDSSKSADETQTGKYGLGFRSCYHLTDNPQVFSTTSLLTLDPHEEFGDYAGGLQLDSLDGDVTNYPNAYRPFHIPDLITDVKNYNGTAIRLPLRSAGQARRSRIKTGSDAEVTPDRVEEWFKYFIETELSVAMLFLKHVAKIELRVISDKESTTLASSHIVHARDDSVLSRRSLNRGRVAEETHYTLEVETREKRGSSSRTKWLVTQFVRNNVEMENDLSSVLGRPHAEVTQQMKKDKLLPHVALALPLTPVHKPLPTGLKGQLFSLLPLPIITEFPLHIHAVFALLSSRQNLRNSQENVSKDSRERLLIEWNRLIFTTILPRAWSYLLQALPLATSEINIYSAWPRTMALTQGDAGYWADLPTNLLEQAAHRPVWPGIGGTECFRLQDVLVVSPSLSDGLISALQSAGLCLSRPPQHIFDLISKSLFRDRILSPISASSALESHLPALQDLSGAETDLIAEYIASAGQISLFRDVPLVRAVSGVFVIVNPDVAILATQQEAELFKEMNPGMLAWNVMLPNTKGLMGNSKSIRRLDTKTVVEYTKRFCARNAPNENASDAAIDWLCRFWEFASSWPERQRLLENIRGEKLVPTRRGELRQVVARAFDPSGDRRLLDVLELLSIPLLHPNISSGSRAFLRKSEVVATDYELGFALDQIRSAPTTASSSDIRDQQRLDLREYFRANLPFSKPRLNGQQISTLLTLPIFSVISPANAPQRDRRAMTKLDSAGPHYHFIDPSIPIVPVLQGVKFVDANACPELTRAITNDVKNEMDILQLILEQPNQWPQQPRPVADRLVERFFSRFSDLPRASRENLRNLAFVDVGDRRVRPPSEIVDPASPISALFNERDRVLPVGNFKSNNPDAILSKLRATGFLQTEISTAMINERLQNMNSARVFTLLQVVDDHYLSHTHVRNDLLPPTFFSKSWLPVSGQCHAVDGCRDRQASDVMLLYDLVLPVVNYTVKSGTLRCRMGWDAVATDTIIEQLKRAVVLDENDEENHHRVSLLIKELAGRHQQEACSSTDIENLQSVLEDSPWIPVPSAGLQLASRCIVDSVDLGPLSRFKRLPESLIRNEAVLEFLGMFGVCRRPTADALLSELDHLEMKVSECVPDHIAIVKTAVSVLTELSEDLQEDIRQHIHVPVATDNPTMVTFRNIDEVYYNNMDDDGLDQSPSVSSAHPSISLELANKLRLQLRSDLEFEGVHEDDFETFNVGEDLTTRIQNVLKAYSEDASSNEWVANADDAGATKVSLICSDRRFKIGNAPSPELKKHFGGPSLIVYNSGVFSEDDFDGLRNVGLGGKSLKPDSIGRFGLGVLSFYHFGDVIMLVSGSSVVFLDPSGESIPKENRKRGGGMRSGLRMKLQECRARYPDLFLAIKDIEGFDDSTTHFEGTIFHVPLRTEPHCWNTKIFRAPISIRSLVDRFGAAFLANAEKSLFFSKIISIQASSITPSESTTLWSVQAEREEDEEQNGIRSHTMKLSVRKARQSVSKWLIMSRFANLPPQFDTLAEKYRLSKNVNAKVAIDISSRHSLRRSHMLFATLPLPITTAFNMHIHSQFILSDSRRHLHFDSSNEQTPGLDTRFNEWLLSALIPPLALHAIAALNTQEPPSGTVPPLWPTAECFIAPPDRLLAESLFKLVPISEELLFRTTSGLSVSPSEAIFGTSDSQSSVHLLLQALRPDQFAPLPFDWSLVLDKVRPEPVWDNIDSPVLVRSLLMDHVHTDSDDSILNLVNLNELVDYLLHGKQSLTGLPLLRLQNGELVCFAGPEDSPIFRFNQAIASSFGEQNVATEGGNGRLRTRTLDAIIQSGATNLRALSALELRKLLASGKWAIPTGHSWDPQDAQGASEWVHEFWKRCNIDDHLGFGLDIQPKDLEDLPLLPTLNGPFVSLQSCNEKRTIWRDAQFRSDRILETLADLGARVVTIPYSSFLWNFTREYKLSGEVDLKIVLECLDDLGDMGRVIAKISPHSEPWKEFAFWITTRNSSILPDLIKSHQIVRKLPLWDAQRPSLVSATPVLRSLDEIVMLPHTLQLSSIAMFMSDTTTWFSCYSWTLSNLLPGDRILDPGRLVEHLVLPRHISRHRAQFHSLLQTLQLLRAPAPSGPFIPNGNLRLCIPDEIFHHEISLYTFAFQQQSGRLIHPSFRDLTSWFEERGLQNQLTSEGFITAAAAIHDIARAEQPITGIEVAMNKLNEEPWVFKLPSRNRDFQRLKNLRFVERRPERSRLPEFEAAANDLPLIAPLDGLVREEFYRVAWTQRGCFAVEPGHDLRAVFPSIGVPTAREVVAHLATLADAVRSNPNFGILLKYDLKATYLWLDENSEDAASDLLARRSEPMFWNVETDSEDVQTWHSANTMWLNTTYDENGQYSVKTFLEQYPDLLRAAGVREFPRLSYSALVSSRLDYLDVVHSNMDRLRTPGCRLADVVIHPRDGARLKAHRFVLATSSSHFEQLFTGNWLEGRASASPQDPVEIQVPDYSCGLVECALHYIYTGKYEPPHSSVVTSDNATAVIATLVQLLHLANLWSLDGLKSEVGKSMMELELVGPSTLQYLIDESEQTQAVDLLAYCTSLRNEAVASGWQQAP